MNYLVVYTVKSRVNIAINDHPLGGPAASVTACCSAILTSVRSGKASIMNFRELPIAGVIQLFFVRFG
jgi:hypothetical protein